MTSRLGPKTHPEITARLTPVSAPFRKQGALGQGEIDRSMVEPPSWAQCLMAMAGVALLVGPTLAVLWPR
jgi:hypothetical protein